MNKTNIVLQIGLEPIIQQSKCCVLANYTIRECGCYIRFDPILILSQSIVQTTTLITPYKKCNYEIPTHMFYNLHLTIGVQISLSEFESL
jgi:hypothetical protein